MPIYCYSQNNSFGEFKGEYTRIFIEAENIEKADSAAQIYFGVYFGGVSMGIDCPCCGDRWYSPYSEEGSDFFNYYQVVNEKVGDSYPMYISDSGDTKYLIPIEED